MWYIYSMCTLVTHVLKDLSPPPPLPLSSQVLYTRSEIFKMIHIVDNAVLLSLPTLKITLSRLSQIAHCTAKSLPCFTGQLETPSCREPQKASADETSAHDVGWLAHISRVNGHPKKRWEQSSSSPIHRMHSDKASGNIFLLRTHINSFCLRSSQTKNPNF